MNEPIRWPMAIYFDASTLPSDLSSPELARLNEVVTRFDIGKFVHQRQCPFTDTNGEEGQMLGLEDVMTIQALANELSAYATLRRQVETLNREKMPARPGRCTETKAAQVLD